MMIETITHASREGARGAGGGPKFFFLFLLLLLAALLLGKAIRRRKYGETHGGYAMRHGGGSAMLTLQDRFARGEIDRVEYDHRKAVLDGADTVPPAPPAAATAAPSAEAEATTSSAAPDSGADGDEA